MNWFTGLLKSVFGNKAADPESVPGGPANDEPSTDAKIKIKDLAAPVVHTKLHNSDSHMSVTTGWRQAAEMLRATPLQEEDKTAAMKAAYTLDTIAGLVKKSAEKGADHILVNRDILMDLREQLPAVTKCAETHMTQAQIYYSPNVTKLGFPNVSEIQAVDLALIHAAAYQALDTFTNEVPKMLLPVLGPATPKSETTLYVYTDPDDNFRWPGSDRSGFTRRPF